MARYTDGQPLHTAAICDVVVGTAVRSNVKMAVGRGSMVHDGSTVTSTVTVAFKVATSRFPIPHRVGAVLVDSPINSCGASGTKANGGHNGNREMPADREVTCSKCLKRTAR